MQFREITHADIPSLFTVRTATDENHYTLEELHKMGITEESVGEKIRGIYKGWLCEADGQTVGFAMGDSATGEMWVIAVLPAYIKRGIGSRLLKLVEDWLWESGNQSKLWLTTAVDTRLRAYSFYLANGWEDDRLTNTIHHMKKTRQP